MKKTADRYDYGITGITEEPARPCRRAEPLSKLLARGSRATGDDERHINNGSLSTNKRDPV